ncbi:hypothetical protein GCM10011490_01440 [Pseudoclavibacter endophyticus]|uniref:Glycosyltransferase family 9 protein n=1 Tax=Pseudoclavibacter endophyticus TaxID=1778590 RepID=A0A6H9WUZ0_9MICO|nr:glycosyltransferase family 9 protein [Pseudoclavibacter endophyticus]KAB1650304.1 glycosyltransferase family 9 protein [Pseudoclavibacter endophyticus]GGA55290.1 hypothetical protein GCM10011490_01440 [Pseudoclavibacter endophyticus]
MPTEGPEPYTADWLAAAGRLGDAPGPAEGRGDRAGPALAPADILVLRALGLGDALTGVAALRGLRRGYPGRRLVLAAPTASGGLLRELGIVDEVLAVPGLVPLPEVSPGLVAVNLHGRGPASHRLLQAARPSRLVAFAAPEAQHPGPEWREDEHEVDRWCRLVRDAGAECSREDLRLRPRAVADQARRRRAGSATVLVHPGAASASRRWPVDRWRQVSAALSDEGHRVVVTGAAAEAPLGRAVAEGLPGVEDHTGRYRLSDLSDRVRDADLVLSADTGVAHLATGWCVPSVVLFGPVPPARWGPAIDAGLHSVLWHGDPDAGEWGDPHGDALDPLLARISVDEVVRAAQAQLSAVPVPERMHREP